jgi:Zn-dependent peptidase ImmA (M78 family)/transcriptional regulator with XRE-family HTH domain
MSGYMVYSSKRRISVPDPESRPDAALDSNFFRSIDPREIGRRLQEARVARGRTQQEAADLLGVARTTVTAIEKGERRIQAEELVRLAHFYGRTVGELLRRGEPMEALAAQLRSTLSARPSLQAELAPHLLEFQLLCEDYLELENICNAPLPRNYPPPYELGLLVPELTAEDVATSERNRMGLGDGPAPDLRDSLETDIGLRIFYLPLPSDVTGLYSYAEPLGGCIAVNRSLPEEMKRQSLAQTYGHFLTHRYRPEVTLAEKPDRRSRGDRFNETFARAFLMPSAGLSRRFNDLYRSRGGKVTPADLCRLAHYYLVSVEAVTLRLEDLRLLPAGVWEKLRQAGFQAHEAQALLGLEATAPKEQLLPTRYLYLAAEAFEREELSEGLFARLLRVDRLEARRLLEEISSREPSQLDKGDSEEEPLNLGQSLRRLGAA